MATTVNVSPSNYYLVENEYVIQKNPSTKKLPKDGSQYIVIEYTIPDSLKHVIESTHSFTVNGLSFSNYDDGNNSNYVELRFAGNKSVTSLSIGQKSPGGDWILERHEWRKNYQQSSWTDYGSDIYNKLIGVPQGKLFIFLTNLRASVDSRTSADVTFSSVTLSVTYTGVSSKSAYMNPKSGYLAPDTAHSFTAGVTYDSDIIVAYTVSSGVLHYKTSTQSGYSNISFTGSTVTIPANTLVSGQNYDVYITATLDDGSTADTNHGTFNTEDGVPSVTPLSPNNEIVRGAVRFSWSYSNTRGTRQYAYEISYRANGGSWVYPTGKVVSSNEYASVNIPEAGTIEWSVRTYNRDDVASAWSSYLSFVNYLPPDPPVITSITQSGRPTISWSSSNQVAYEVKVESSTEIEVYNSGQVYSGNQFHKLDEYLSDGLYTFSVRIISTLGLTSEWAVSNYTQSFPDLSLPVFTLENTDDGVLITIESNLDFVKYYVLRNGELIGSTTATFTDLFVAGFTEYTVIGVTSSDESAFVTQSINHKVRKTSIKLEDGTTIDASHRWNARLSPAKTVNPEFGLYSYIGASRPEIITSKMRDIRYAFGFYDRDRIAETLIGQPLFYSDIFGNADWVQITAISRTDMWYGNETTLELTAVQHSEDIDYDNT